MMWNLLMLLGWTKDKLVADTDLLPLRRESPQVAPGATGTSDDASGGDPEPKRLTVRSGIALSGEIEACDRLVIQGTARVTLKDTRAVEVTEGGRFIGGKAEVEEAVVGGVYEGELTVRGRLLVRSTGRVDGTIRYGELELERGGRLSGSVEALGSRASSRPTP